MSTLQQKIQTKELRIGVIGLGYVGLPLAMQFAQKGFRVTGFEVDGAKVKKILARKSYIGDVPTATLSQQVLQKRFIATTDFSALARMDAIIICVPTPLNKTREPDISFIQSATHKIVKTLRRNQVIVLESTTYPGTTRESVLPALESTGLKVGKDFYLSFSPERIDPGNTRYTLHNTPKVVGGLTAACRDLTALLYRQIIERVITVSSAEAAELTKLLENTFRAVNIGLVNELMLICDKLGLDVWEVIHAASTKPYGFMPFYPGPGLGGHCIPVDPHYLSWKMKSLNFVARFIELAGEVNSHMPEFVVEKLARLLNKKRRSINGAKVVLLGVAYKANVSDVRESPALDVIHLLLEQGAQVAYHDPYVPSLHIGSRKLRSKPYSPALLRQADVVVITTAHQTFNPQEILKHSRLILDTRNMCQGLRAERLVRL